MAHISFNILQDKSVQHCTSDHTFLWLSLHWGLDGIYRYHTDARLLQFSNGPHILLLSVPHIPTPELPRSKYFGETSIKIPQIVSFRNLYGKRSVQFRDYSRVLGVSAVLLGLYR
jgi:hypothetical protein